MDHIFPLLLACLVARGACEPLAAAVRARARSDSGVYAAQFARRYSRAAFMALPLHAPIPVLQLLSEGPAPAQHSHHAPSVYAASAPQAWHAAPTDQSPGEAAAASHAYYTKTRHPLHYQTTSTWYGNKQQPQSSSSSWLAQPTVADTTPALYGQRLRPAPPRYATSAPSPAEPKPAWDQSPVQSAPQDAPDAREPAELQDNIPVILYASPSEHGGYRYRRRPAKRRQPEPIVIRIHKHRVVRDD